MFSVDFGWIPAHRDQDLVERVGLHWDFFLVRDLLPLPAQCQPLHAQFRQHNPRRSGTGNDDRLLVQRGGHRRNYEPPLLLQNGGLPAANPAVYSGKRNGAKCCRLPRVRLSRPQVFY